MQTIHPHLLQFIGLAIAVRIVVRAVERRISHEHPFLVPVTSK
jgi:hypothetical protein